MPARSRPKPAASPTAATPRVATPPRPTAVAVAQRRTHGARTRVFAFLREAGLIEEAEHLLAIEERVHAGGRPARYHAALSTRLLLKGVADRCLPARVEPWTTRDRRRFEAGESNVGNRLVAFVEATLGPLALERR